MSANVIAVCGKGGVGKTTVSAMLAKLLSEKQGGPRVLALDADHAGGLSVALGLSPKQTLNQIRLDVARRLREGTGARRTIPQDLDYLLLDALCQRGSLAFLAAGRPADRGCYCALNSFIRQAIATLADQFDVTIVDAEAGVEQVNRDVIADVDYLLLVCDTSVKSLRVAGAVQDVIASLDHSPGVGLLINRVRDPGELSALRQKTRLPVVGWIPDDDIIRRFDTEERSYLELPECPATSALMGLLEGPELLATRPSGA